MLRTTTTLFALMLVAHLGLAQSARQAGGDLTVFGAETPGDGAYQVETGSRAGLELTTRIDGGRVAFQLKTPEGWSAFQTAAVDANGELSQGYDIPDWLAGAHLRLRALVFDQGGRSSPSNEVSVKVVHGPGRPGDVSGDERSRPMIQNDIDPKWEDELGASGLRARPAKPSANADVSSAGARSRPPHNQEQEELTTDQIRALKKAQMAAAAQQDPGARSRPTQNEDLEELTEDQIRAMKKAQWHAHNQR